MLGQSQSAYQLIPKCEDNYYKKKYRRTDQQADPCTVPMHILPQMFPKRGWQTTIGPRDTFFWTADRDTFHIKIRVLMTIFNCIVMYFYCFPYYILLNLNSTQPVFEKSTATNM